MGKLYISTKCLVEGESTENSFTNWKRFENLILSWKKKHTHVEIKEDYCGKPTYVIFSCSWCGEEGTARYSPSEDEKDKAAFMDKEYPQDKIN